MSELVVCRTAKVSSVARIAASLGPVMAKPPAIAVTLAPPIAVYCAVAAPKPVTSTRLIRSEPSASGLVQVALSPNRMKVSSSPDAAGAARTGVSETGLTTTLTATGADVAVEPSASVVVAVAVMEASASEFAGPCTAKLSSTALSAASLAWAAMERYSRSARFPSR